MALDLVTMGHALDALEQRFLRGCTWDGLYAHQNRFLNWWRENRDHISLLEGLKSFASTDANELNKFLTDHGFEPNFTPLGPDGIGAASILDMLVEWVVSAQITTLRARQLPGHDWSIFPAFQVPSQGVILYEVEGSDSPLVELLTKSGDSLWIMMSDKPRHELDLALRAQDILKRPRQLTSSWDGVVVPKIDLRLEPDLSWMLGVTALQPGGSFVVDQAFQQFRLRMNEQGARAKVATGFGMERGVMFTLEPLQIDRPFIGFFTQKGLRLPIAVFYADFDCWREPAGSLKEL